MARKSVLVLLAFSLFLGSQCWIINDISPRFLEDNGLYYLELEELTPEELTRLRYSLIFPGTKWCGPGNVAQDYDDLGSSQAADACCRDHDNCSEYISAGESKYNLDNKSHFTRLSCECDEAFRRCLQKANTKSSASIGYMYFNAIGAKCYKKDYLTTGCKVKGGIMNTKCIEYSYDTSSRKSYQWFDVPNYDSARLRPRNPRTIRRP